MSIRLAPARNPARIAGRDAAARGMLTRARVMAANDDTDTARAAVQAAATAFDPLLVDALRHFARHGLDSARVARSQAERARLEGNGPGAEHWIAITGMFDRRLASAAIACPSPG